MRLRLSPDGAGIDGDWEQAMAEREREADELYAALTPLDASADEARVLRQALAGMLWTKQFFHFDVDRWLEGDPALPAPPEERRHGRNHEWRHLNNADVISMPDKWEYPWYAAWDLAFHCVPLALVDPQFAKDQLLLLCREWYMHPNGQLPAYEWSFGDVNPPVHAWAALRVFEIDGSRDHEFLQRIFQKLLLNFTWWVNRKDAAGNNVFEGGFLGLDNIGPIDRSAQLPVAGRLAQADGTAWMAMYCLNLLEIALVLAEHDRSTRTWPPSSWSTSPTSPPPARRCGTRRAASTTTCCHRDDGDRIPLRVRSVVGLLPLAATTTFGPGHVGEPARLRRSPPVVRRQQARVRRQHRPHPRARRRRGPPAVGRAARAARPHPRRDARRGRVPLPARAAGPVGRSPRRALHRRPGRHALLRRLRAGRVDHRPVRRQLQLAGPGVVPRQPPPRRSGANGSPASTATT